MLRLLSHSGSSHPAAMPSKVPTLIPNLSQQTPSSENPSCG